MDLDAGVGIGGVVSAAPDTNGEVRKLAADLVRTTQPTRQRP